MPEYCNWVRADGLVELSTLVAASLLGFLGACTAQSNQAARAHAGSSSSSSEDASRAAAARERTDATANTGSAQAESSESSPAFFVAPPAAPPDLTLLRPESASLMGVANGQVWIAFEAPTLTGVQRYDAVLDLESGCVTETYDWTWSKTHGGVARDLGFLDRFPVHYLTGYASRAREFHGLAYSTDKQAIAIGSSAAQRGSSSDSSGIRVSLDGGRTFRGLGGSEYFPQFVGGFLVTRTLPAAENDAQSLLVRTLPDLDHPRSVPFRAGYLDGGIDGSSLLFWQPLASASDRCVRWFDVATATYRPGYCIDGVKGNQELRFWTTLSSNGAYAAYGTGESARARVTIVDARTGTKLRTLARHVAMVDGSAIADDGSYFRQSTVDRNIYVSGPRGERTIPSQGDDFLGLDLAGRALLFRTTSARGNSLANDRCALLRAVDPYEPGPN